jgi:hypothetical protein
MLDIYKKIFLELENEWGYVIFPNDIKDEIPLILHFHGNGGYVKNGKSDWLDEPRKQKFFKPILDSGFAIAGCHATGDHWGRESALEKNYEFFDLLKNIDNLNINNITTWGCGLGASAAWLTSIGKLNPYVNNFISQQGVLNFESIIRREKFKTQLIEAHSHNTNLDVEDALKLFDVINPITITKNAAKIRKIQFPRALFIHGDSDENVNYFENPATLHKILTDTNTYSKLNPLEGVGHATYEHGDDLGALIVEFLKKG